MDTYFVSFYCQIRLAIALLSLSSVAIQANHSTEKKKPVFAWKVTDPKTNQIAYLVGSLHLGKKELYPLPTVIETAFEKSDVLAIELKIPASHLKEVSFFDNNILGWTFIVIYALLFFEGLGIVLADLSMIHLTGEQTALCLVGIAVLCMMLREGMRDKKETHLLNKALQKLEIPSSYSFLTRYLAPSFIIRKILDHKLTAKFAGTVILGIEQHFIPKANKAAKPIIELEKLETHLQLNRQLKPTPKSFLKDFNKRKKLIKKTLLAWQTGNIHLLDKVIEAYDARILNYRKILLTDRNIAMTAQIKTLLQGDKTAFILIGVMHYAGETGILALLEKEGYIIEQLYDEDYRALILP